MKQNVSGEKYIFFSCVKQNEKNIQERNAKISIEKSFLWNKMKNKLFQEKKRFVMCETDWTNTFSE